MTSDSPLCTDFSTEMERIILIQHPEYLRLAHKQNVRFWDKARGMNFPVLLKSA
jgi:hypothetical protein